MRRRIILTALGACLALGLIVLVGLIPTKTASPNPSRWYSGPVTYEHSPSSQPIQFGGFSGELLDADRFDLSMNFEILGRPDDFTYLLSTAFGVTSGFKVSLDKYGNLFLQFPRYVTGATSDYVILLKSPTELSKEYRLQVRFDRDKSSLVVTLNKKMIALRDARGLETLDVKNLRNEFSSLEIGGSGSRHFIGNISYLELDLVDYHEEWNLVGFKFVLLQVIVVALIILFRRTCMGFRD